MIDLCDATICNEFRNGYSVVEFSNGFFLSLYFIYFFYIFLFSATDLETDSQSLNIFEYIITDFDREYNSYLISAFI